MRLTRVIRKQIHTSAVVGSPTTLYFAHTQSTHFMSRRRVRIIKHAARDTIETRRWCPDGFQSFTRRGVFVLETDKLHRAFLSATLVALSRCIFSGFDTDRTLCSPFYFVRRTVASFFQKNQYSCSKIIPINAVTPRHVNNHDERKSFWAVSKHDLTSSGIRSRNTKRRRQNGVPGGGG